MIQQTVQPDLMQVIEEQGQIVLSYAYSTDKPGGSGVYDIYQWNGRYYMFNEDFDEVEGPYETLRDALVESGLNLLYGAMGAFRCSEMDDATLAQLLENQMQEDVLLRVNGVWWLFHSDGTRHALSEPEAHQRLTPQQRALWQEIEQWLHI